MWILKTKNQQQESMQNYLAFKVKYFFLSILFGLAPMYSI